MLVSLNWLKEYVDYGSLTPEELGELITKSGIEVDAIHYIAEQVSDVVVGHVTSCEQHPNADKLKLCQVDIGTETLQIICGAPNVAQGQKVAVAKPGAVLPGDFKIKKVKLRGIESNGMICSLDELGVREEYIAADHKDGIFVFPTDVEIGQDVVSLLNLDDAILEFDLTPNRSDALSMIGVAYEVAAILDLPIRFPDESVSMTEEETSKYISVNVENADLVPYYGAAMIKDVTIQDSPLWMQNYLMAAGIRPINNVVDITNYVLLEYGQPLHAFDYDRLQSKEILVRNAVEGEILVTLDDKERKLREDNVVITDGENPIALAGVMGGLSTEVIESTKTILLEFAYFDGLSVRKTVQETGLRSESSTRFEKGVDPQAVKLAGLRACQLLEKYAGGKVLQNPVIFDAFEDVERTVEMEVDTINSRLGTEITTEEIEDILRKLRFEYEVESGQFTVRIPSRRGDITIFEDMLEEVARIYGYDNLPFTLPANASTPGALSEEQRIKREVNQYLQSVGLMETITYSLTNQTKIKQLISPEVVKEELTPVELAMPMSEDHKYLRLSILPELLHVLSYNRARSQTDLAYYELGSIFINKEEKITKQPKEALRVAGGLTGTWFDHKWEQEHKEVDFYVVKGIVEGLANHLRIPFTFTQAKLPDMHPGRAATVSIGNQVIGFVGQVHPSLTKELDLKETYVFDLNMEAILSTYDSTPKYDKISRYPSITRDIALILDTAVFANDVKERMEKKGGSLVKEVEVFDVYTGDNLEEGKKSIAYRLHFQDPNKTLKDSEVEELYKEIVQDLIQTYQASVRS